MAIINKCCCCGVRGGSIACAVYSMILSFAGAIWFGYNIKLLNVVKSSTNDAVDAANDLLDDLRNDDTFKDLGVDIPDTTTGDDDDPASVLNVLYSVYVIALIVFIVLFVSGVILIAGVCKDMKQFLFPYIGAQAFHLFWYVYYFIALAYYLYLSGFDDFLGKVFLGTVVLLWIFAIVDIICIICVVSQYQEYRDGRGCATDNQQPPQGPAVVQQQPMIQQNPNVAYNPVPEKEAPPAY